MKNNIRIGVDFDNTIVCYDKVFHQVALDKSYISGNLAINKTAVRDYMRRVGREEEWILLQGLVYGDRMKNAYAFSGVIDFFFACKGRNIPVLIISHKTRYSKKGPQFDLHRSARNWLTMQGFFSKDGIGLSPEQVFFMETRAEKIACIRKQNCTHFIDDLPEFLTEPDFPDNVERFLFDPNGDNMKKVNFQSASTWKELQDRLLTGIAIL